MVLTLSEIQFAVGQWSAVQFPANTPLEPLEGLIEELGEAAHARLKRRQGIRHTPEECVAMERDAIGDMGIYLCDFAARAGILLGDPRTCRYDRPDLDDSLAFGLIARVAGELVYQYNDWRTTGTYPDWMGDQTQTVADRLALYARLRGWDFLGILNETWARVSKRDWRADPMKAGGHS